MCNSIKIWSLLGENVANNWPTDLITDWSTDLITDSSDFKGHRFCLKKGSQKEFNRKGSII